LLARKPVSNHWIYCFLERHEDDLVYKNAAPMDRLRHQADSYLKYQAYFTYLESKVEEYQVPPDQTYNMDEKGFGCDWKVGRFGGLGGGSGQPRQASTARLNRRASSRRAHPPLRLPQQR
jgi:hypothetical protein